MRALTSRQANEIVDAHEIRQMMYDEEERALLRENNPELFDAYLELLAIADEE